MMNNKKMPRKRQLKGNQFIAEEIRIAVQMQLQQFVRSENDKEFAFPSSLTADERAYIHELAKQLGLQSKSRGKATNRFLTVYKREGSSIVQTDPSFKLARPSRQEIISLLQKFPLTSKERQDLLPLTERDRGGVDAVVKDKNKSFGRLSSGSPQVPLVVSANKDLLRFRQALPIWPRRREIIDTINNNQVIVISGQTGSGKTTQVPQFIMEQCSADDKPCRIICTQPRRISAVSVCERVSAERNESVGQSIGYQIRLESLISPRTVLTYCTDGVLLRSLMGGDATLATVTHIIIDEVHERNRYSDFLLIVIKEALVKYRSLKLILMSATLDTAVFTTYFNNCPVISVPGRQFDVEEFFLEDVLRYTGYSKKKTMKKASRVKRGGNRAELDSWSKMVTNQVEPSQVFPAEVASNALASSLIVGPEIEEVALPEHIMQLMDQAIQNAFIAGTEEAFNFLAYTMQTENIPVDYQHSGTCVTPLMVAACRGNLDWTEQFLELGADLDAKDAKEMTALDWARKLEQADIVDLLEAYGISIEAKSPTEVALPMDAMPQLKEEDKQLLDLYYQNSCDENESIDYDLVMDLLTQIHTTTDSAGAILIFIAGYDDIVVLRDRIMECDKVLKSSHDYTLYTLHSNMQTSDQKRVFRPTPKGVRKIILSTNIAETSITIDDVVYVIDCGKVKEKSFDCMSGACLLRATWISKSCSRQRRGRAGRTQPGKCFHVFSSVRYAFLMNHRTPEILRLPLQELCLQTKLLAPPNTAIADFLAKAIQPPSSMVARTAVVLLKAMDALDPWEDLTELGRHLLDLPVEPRLGKTLLYSVVLKCLDPVLTIICCLAYKEPFVLPSQPALKWAANESRRNLSAGAMSDHMALLRGFQCWQMARANSKERLFCDKNFLSSATLEMIQGTRTQLLGQLRASGFVRPRGYSDMRDLNHNSENWAVVKAALCAGMYPNLARVDRKHSLLRTQKEIKVTLHPSSTIRDTTSLKGTVQSLPSDWVIYEEMSRPGKFCNIRCCTVVSPITVAIFAGPSRMPLANITEASAGGMGAESDSEEEDIPLQETGVLKVDDWVTFRVDREAVQLSLQLRQKWNAMFLRRIKNPDKAPMQVDEAVLKAVIQVLTDEEKSLGLSQPEGVGQRPRQTNSDYSQENIRRGCEDKTSFPNNNVVANGQTNTFYSKPRPERHNTDLYGEYSALPRSNVQNMAPRRNVQNMAPQVPLLSENATGGTNMSYFIIKAASERAIEFSAHHSVWAFAPNTERKLMRLRKADHVVVLLFSVQGSGHFQGFAVLTGARVPGLSTEVWGEQAARCPNPPLSVKWVKRGNVPFQATRHMLNAYNENNRVQTSRDGQELEPNVAQQLCALWSKTPNVMDAGLEPTRSGVYGAPPHHGRPIRGMSQSGRARNGQHRFAGQAAANSFRSGTQYYEH